MKPGVVILAAALSYALLTMWVEERWAWSLFQVGVFVLAGWRVARPHRRSIPLALAPLAAAALWPPLQLALGASISPGPTWDAALNWFTFLVVFALSCDLLSRAAPRRGFLGAVVLFGMFLAAVATTQKYSSGGKIFWLFPSGFPDDVLGPFVNRNQFAAWVELLLPPALYLAATQRRLKPLYGSAAAVMFGAIIASASRAGFALACGEVLAVGIALAARGAAPRKALALGAVQFVTLALIASAVAGWQGLESRLESRGPEALRVDAMKASIQMVRERPWTGSGLGTWSILYPRYAGFDAGVFVNQAHNDWAQWAAEGGLPFLFFLTAFAALLWKPAVQSIYGLGTVAFLLHAIVDYPMQQRPALAAWFFAMAGATAAWTMSSARDR
ncbi:MAG TPA: O-antigen ligase family protein [Bryobacteraceae bacterium]|nr:O-antigen ligase family protein [Bryobacteraceae bacterium]